MSHHLLLLLLLLAGVAATNLPILHLHTSLSSSWLFILDLRIVLFLLLIYIMMLLLVAPLHQLLDGARGFRILVGNSSVLAKVLA
jgi:hypothetical protein